MRPALALAVLALCSTICDAKKQPLRLKQSGSQKERPPPPPNANSMYAAMDAFHRERVGQLSKLSEQQLERKLLQAHIPDTVMADIRKARYLSKRGRVRLAPKEAMVDALTSIDDATEAARSKPLSALVVWTRRSGAPAAAIAAALSPETPVAEARAALTAVGAGSSLARSSSTKTPSADVLANDAEKLLSLVPPAAVDAGRLYAMAAELCESGAELTDLNSQHTALAAQAERGPGFPTARDIDQARAEREQNAKTRDSAKLVPDLDVSGLSKVLARPTTGATKGVVVVMFYANWCSHCIDTLPVFAKAKEILAATKQGDALVQVDVAKHKQLTRQYDVKAFPTIRAFLRGKPVGPPYDGLRDADEMAKWTRETIANPPAPDESTHTQTNVPEAGGDNSKASRSMPRAPAGHTQAPARQKNNLPDDEKLANAMRDIGRRMAERQQKRTAEHDDKPDAPDDPDGLDEGWFPMGKRKSDKGNQEAQRGAFSTDPLYGHADEF